MLISLKALIKVIYCLRGGVGKLTLRAEICYYSFKHNVTLTLASSSLLQKNNLIELLKAFKTHAPFSELSEFAITLLEIVVNQVGCEQLFSDLKVKQAAHYNQLSIPKLEKMTRVSICFSLITFFE